MTTTSVGALTNINQAERALSSAYRYAQVPTRAKAASSEATKDLAEWMAPHDCTLRVCYFVPTAAVSGANTNTTHLNVLNRVLTGTSAGELSSLELTSGNDLVMGLKTDLNSGTAYSQDLPAGTILALQGEVVNTGLAVPEGTWIIGYDGA